MNNYNFIINEDTPDKIVIKDIGPWNIYDPVCEHAEKVFYELKEQLNGRNLEIIDEFNNVHIVLNEDGVFCGIVLKPLE